MFVSISPYCMSDIKMCHKKYLCSCRLIPVPMVGFKELLRRLKVQDQMTKQHQTRLDVRFLILIVTACC